MPRRKLRSAPAVVASVGALLGRWPSVAEFARDIGINPSHAQTMKTRGSIPVDYWPATIVAAKQRHIEGVTAEHLLKLHARDRIAPPGLAPSTAKARVIKSGNSQAVQLPKQFHFRGKEVKITRRGDEVVLRENSPGMGRAFEIMATIPLNLAAIEALKSEAPQERDFGYEPTKKRAPRRKRA